MLSIEPDGAALHGLEMIRRLAGADGLAAPRTVAATGRAG